MQSNGYGSSRLLVIGYQNLIQSVSLPDPDDRHVLAAAIVGRCDVILTRDLKDFPEYTFAQAELKNLDSN
jgi:predicted nucleic acid-binding protein